MRLLLPNAETPSSNANHEHPRRDGCNGAPFRDRPCEKIRSKRKKALILNKRKLASSLQLCLQQVRGAPADDLNSTEPQTDK